MNTNDRLLATVKSRRQKQTEFGYGIITADRYVETLRDSIGLPACYRFVGTRQTSFDDLLRKASQTLVYSNSEMVVEAKQTDANGQDTFKDVELPKNTLMAFRHVLTTSRKDRDGDVLHPDGAMVDPKMLLLFNHVPTLPIGKMVAVVEQNAKRLSLISAIVDMNELSHDAAVMVDNDMARFSHGFRALEFTEMKAGSSLEDGGGFDVKRFEIMEESMVSCPANVDADVEEVMLSMVEGDKLTSPLMREYGKAIRDRRSVSVPGVTIKYSDRVGDRQRELTCNSLADLKAAADAGLIGGKSDEDQSGGGGGAGEKERSGVGTPEETDEGGQQKAEASGDAEVMVSVEVSKESAKRVEKAGRVLSKANEGKIRNAKESVDEAVGMEGVPRPVKAMLREASKDLGDVVSALGVEGETAWTVEQAFGRFLTGSTGKQKQRMADALTIMKQSEERKQLAKQYRALSARK